MPSLIGDALRWHATYTPRKTAIIAPGGTLTYAALWLRTVRLVEGLVRLGIGPGDRIALMLANGAPYMELYHAAGVLGAAVVPLNFRFVPSEAEYVVTHSGARALVYDAAFRGTFDPVRERLAAAGTRTIVVSDKEGPRENETDYEDLLACSSATNWQSTADPEACYFQGYTSGTTGFPKGCVNPHRHFADCLKRIGLVYDVAPDDVELVAAPLFHEAPALFALTQMFRGGTVVVTPDPSPESVLRLIEQQRVSWTFMVPTMWTSMMSNPDLAATDLSSLRMLISGGSPLHTHTKNALIERLPKAGLHEFYGATEMGLITNLRPEDQKRKVRSVGRPVPGMYVELRDEAGKPVPQGEIGEIHIGGSTLIREYYLNLEATERARSAGGFFTLGDMGRFDDEGYLHIVDRKKDMIISGGENIFPNDIEDVLYQHSAVHMVAVVGAPDDRWGEVVVGVVVVKPGQTVSEIELLEHCKSRLSSFKVPKSIDFRDQLPLSSFGKILRRDVRQDYWAGRDVQV